MWMMSDYGKRVPAHFMLGCEPACKVKIKRPICTEDREGRELCTACLRMVRRMRGLTPEMLASFRQAYGYEWRGF